jgi:hypothetical protein
MPQDAPWSPPIPKHAAVRRLRALSRPARIRLPRMQPHMLRHTFQIGHRVSRRDVPRGTPTQRPCSGNVGLSRRCQDQHGQADEQDNHRVLPPRSRLPAPAGDASGDGRGDNCWQCQPPMTRPKPSAESGRPSQGQTAAHSCTRQYLVEDRPLWVCPAHAAFELVRRGAPYRTGRRDILGCLGRQDNGDVPKGLYSLADTSLEAGPSERSGLRRSRRPGLSAAGRRSSHHHRPSTMTTTQRRGTIG